MTEEADDPTRLGMPIDSTEAREWVDHTELAGTAEANTESAYAWGLADDSHTDDMGPPRRRFTPAGITIAAVVVSVVAAIGVAAFGGFRIAERKDRGTATTAPIPAQSAPGPSPSEAAPSKAPFVGEWGQHAMTVTLAPDGTAHYAMSSGFNPDLGEFNGIAWSATWSPMTATTAMIVLTKQLDATGDTTGFKWVRHEGEALTFTLISGRYATITDPATNQPVTLCPRRPGFQDSQGLCGA